MPIACTFVHRDQFLKGVREVFSLFITNDTVERFLSCILIIRNSKTLLTGGYGSGKNTFVEIAARTFFGTDLAIVRCHQELTTLDILWNVNIQRTLDGKIGAIMPRPLISASFKYLNEIQRLNTQCQNALLGILTDRVASFSDATEQIPDYVCILDRNPHDIGTVGIVKALLDRIDFHLDLPYLGMEDTTKLLRIKFGGKQKEDLRELATPVLDTHRMDEIWRDVEKVSVPLEVVMKLSMISILLRKCIKVDKSITSAKFRLQCEGCPYSGEVCNKLEMPLGHRWTDSTIKLAKACAWRDGKNEVDFSDILWSLPRTIPHRLDLKRNLFLKFANETEWVEQELMENIEAKLSLWDEALSLFSKAIEGEQEASASLAKLREKCLAVRELHTWASSRETDVAKLPE